jgi:hypothetical protein
MAQKILTAERLREIVVYDALTGIFIRRIDTNNGRWKAGQVVGSIGSDGYLLVSIDGQQYRANRAAWLYMKGVWPAGEVDHKDTDKLNNRWLNLRDVPPLFNQQNKRKARKNNKSGLLGVFPNKKGFSSQLRIPGGKRIHLGTWKTPEEAHAAHMEAKLKYHEGFIP